MAASTYSIILSNGQTISVYQAANQPVNSNPVLSLVGVAVSTTPTTDFSVMSPACVSDIIVTSALTAGGIEVYNVTTGVRTSLGWNNLETFLNTNTTRNPARLCFRPGMVYRFIQTVAGNA